MTLSLSLSLAHKRACARAVQTGIAREAASDPRRGRGRPDRNRRVRLRRRRKRAAPATARTIYAIYIYAARKVCPKRPGSGIEGINRRLRGGPFLVLLLSGFGYFSPVCARAQNTTATGSGPGSARPQRSERLPPAETSTTARAHPSSLHERRRALFPDCEVHTQRRSIHAAR